MNVTSDTVSLLFRLSPVFDSICPRILAQNKGEASVDRCDVFFGDTAPITLIN